jgi:hypothetical protein
VAEQTAFNLPLAKLQINAVGGTVQIGKLHFPDRVHFKTAQKGDKTGEHGGFPFLPMIER